MTKDELLKYIEELKSPSRIQEEQDKINNYNLNKLFSDMKVYALSGLREIETFNINLKEPLEKLGYTVEIKREKNYFMKSYPYLVISW